MIYALDLNSRRINYSLIATLVSVTIGSQYGADSQSTGRARCEVPSRKN